MLWWMWMLFGFGLLAVEMFTPGLFYFFFFGVGAILVGLLGGLGLEVSSTWQWLLFSLLSLATLALFRQQLARLLSGKHLKVRTGDLDSLVGEMVTLLDDLAPNAAGKAEGRGSSWTVVNGGAEPLSKGQRCRVYQIEGLTLWVRAL
ncbi:MAG: NfeD family protein [Deltaproteobacteria bacterium]|nr:NfeD family protein [Deltaproteobacteria bacterium]